MTTKPTVAAVLAMLCGCGDPPLQPGGTTTDPTNELATTEASIATSSSDDGADETATASSSGDESEGGSDQCPPEPDTPIPPPPVHCSGADVVLTGDVIIEATPGGDGPELLANVRRIEGALRIHGTSLTNLDFMACLQEVTEDVTIFDNDQLTNVDGLRGLVSIGTDLVVSSNDALVELQGPPDLERIVSNIIIRDNASLQRILGFQSLVGIEGYTFIDEAGEEVFAGGNLTIQLNPVLTDISGLGGLLVINGVLAVTNNLELCCSHKACVFAGLLVPEEPEPSWDCHRPNC